MICFIADFPPYDSGAVDNDSVAYYVRTSVCLSAQSLYDTIFYLKGE